jgi:hypothetical protein
MNKLALMINSGGITRFQAVTGLSPLRALEQMYGMRQFAVIRPTVVATPRPAFTAK